MKQALNRYSIRAWQRSRRGRQVQALEEAEMRRMLPDVFGRHVLQVGQWGGKAGLLQSSEMLHRAVLGFAPGVGAQVLGEPEQLPIAAKSVDAVVLPHTLEFSSAPHSVLREINRILSDRGRLFILGFDPWTPWALRQRVGLRYRAFPPGARFVGRGRVCDWLELLDFEVAEVRDFGVPWLDRWFAAGPKGYLVVANKRVIPLNPVRQGRRAAIRPLALPMPGASATAVSPDANRRS